MLWSPPFLLALLPSAQAAQRGGSSLRAHMHPELPRLDDMPRYFEDDVLLTKRWANDTYRYRNSDTECFLVNTLPEVDWDFGEMYSGLIPTGTNESEALFFIFKPKEGDPVDELTIWLNGGPGCSSLEGWLQENGPISWQPGTYKPVPNPYSWDKETNMIWIEQPIGTGFSIGTPHAENEYDIAADFLGFQKNFMDKFGIKNYKIYGESYAGRYIPYISSAMVDKNDTEYYDISGALMYDPCIGAIDTVQQEYTAYPHVEKYRNIWGLNDTYMETLKGLHEQCGFKAFIDQYLTFPPSGVQPQLSWNYTANATCDIFDMAYYAAVDLNPCFNLYEIVDHCPLPYDPLASPAVGSVIPSGAQIYFQRPDVLAAIHAPTSFNWSDCSEEPVFPHGDNSDDSIQYVLPHVIEHTNRVLVSNAEWDYVIITNGTLLGIQNMTWNGELGFQKEPTEPFYVEQSDLVVTKLQNTNNTNPQGTMGIKHYERGLMWVESFQSGHMQPQYQPRAAQLHLRWLLGRIDDL